MERGEQGRTGRTERGRTVLVAITIGSMEANPKGYSFPIHVTKGHEHQAMEAQRRKKPSRLASPSSSCWASRVRSAPITSSSD